MIHMKSIYKICLLTLAYDLVLIVIIVIFEIKFEEHTYKGVFFNLRGTILNLRNLEINNDNLFQISSKNLVLRWNINKRRVCLLPFLLSFHGR